ncbi:kinase-like domain-containing protein [Dichotomocladium elegans]|nr:kinase-like domain-containing protein [Dichotomocladium elegans]
MPTTPVSPIRSRKSSSNSIPNNHSELDSTSSMPSPVMNDSDDTLHAPVLSPAGELTPPPSLSASPKPSPASKLSSEASPLDQYIIKQTLGTGNFGRVHLALSKADGQYYAIKTLNKQDIVRQNQTRHINNEQAILRKVDHPFLVNLLDTFQDDTHLFLVMEYIQGGELFRILRQQKRFSESTTQFYAAEVILALEYLHDRDIAYRDIKPENILLDADGHIKLVDFGFAKMVPDLTWTVCGTPDYFAPEIIRSKGYSKAVDWWCLGVLMYEMLVGHPPFTEKNPVDMYQNILDCNITWPDDPVISSVAKDLIQNLLTPDLSRRYGNLKDGCKDIKKHAFFDDLDFDKIAQREGTPPYRPEIKSESDTACFDKYREPLVPYGQTQAIDSYRDQFPEF